MATKRRKKGAKKDRGFKPRNTKHTEKGGDFEQEETERTEEIGLWALGRRWWAETTRSWKWMAAEWHLGSWTHVSKRLGQKHAVSNYP
jgi:hypothetical protein